jgi:hypothetical protein
MTQIPEHILAQAHLLAADGEPVEHIAFLLRMTPEAVEAELKNPTVTPPNVNTTKPRSPQQNEE